MPRDWDEVRGFIDVGDHALACAVTRPHAEGRHPAVLLLPPLGALDRTGPIDAARDGIAALLRSFADAGFVTMRVNPCGVGESTGPSYEEASWAIEIEGYRAAIEAISGLAFVDASRVFVIGSSLGGAIAPVIVGGVVGGTDVRGVIVVGAPSRRWSTCLADGARRQLALAGLTNEEVDREADRAARLYDLVLREGRAPSAIARDHLDLATSRAFVDLSETHLHGRALHYFRALDRVDPEAAWSAVRASVLAVHGEHDFIVADDDHTRIAAFVDPTGQRANAITLPGLDHDLRRKTSRAAAFEQRGRGDLDDEAARTIIAWMRARIARS